MIIAGILTLSPTNKQFYFLLAFEIYISPKDRNVSTVTSTVAFLRYITALGTGYPIRQDIALVRGCYRIPQSNGEQVIFFVNKAVF